MQIQFLIQDNSSAKTTVNFCSNYAMMQPERTCDLQQQSKFLNSMRHTSAGFSLIELLVVMVILSAAVAFIVASLPALRTGPSLQQTARTLMAHMRRARTLAIATRKQVNLTVDVDKKTYWIDGKRPRRQALSQAVAISITTARSKVADKLAAIGFFPDGTSTGGKIELKHHQRTVRIAVDWRTGGALVSSEH